MPEPRRLVGLDVGGTSIKVGAVSSEGEILERNSAPFEREGSAEAIVATMAELARSVKVEDCLGIGIAGLVDHAGGRVEASPNLKPIEGIPLCERLAQELGLSPDAVRIENDANVAALGEHWLGDSRDSRDVLVVTLGTRIGGGLILDGELCRGPGGLAGEIGHVVVDPSGPLCGCGAHGCSETLASGRSAQRRARERGLPAEDPGNVVVLAEMARNDDADARRFFVDVGRDLGYALATTVSLLDLRTFVIGGGFGAALDVLEPGIRDGLEERAFGERVKSIRLLPARLGSDAGWVGSARLNL